MGVDTTVQGGIRNYQIPTWVDVDTAAIFKKVDGGGEELVGSYTVPHSKIGDQEVYSFDYPYDIVDAEGESIVIIIKPSGFESDLSPAQDRTMPAFIVTGQESALTYQQKCSNSLSISL